MKDFYIENLGCAKNQVDAEIMVSALSQAGWNYINDPAEADVIIINTCGFIQTAKEESLQTIIAFRRNYPDARIIATGCLSQRYGRELLQSLPEADAFFGNRAPSRIVSFLKRLEGAGQTEEVGRSGSDLGLSDNKRPENVLIDLDEEPGDYLRRRQLLGFPRSAFLKIAEGCDNNCAYCAIPQIRGRLRSRSMEDVLSELRGLVEGNIYEINLIAQDLASFGKDRGRSEFPQLLKRLAREEGDFRLRLLYIYPEHFDMEITEICAEEPRVYPYFDLPFQHAAESILRAMGRPGSSDFYLDLIESIRKRLPDAVFRSSFILGFPGEEEKEFEELLNFLKAAQLDWAGFFQYSPEEGTPAYRLYGEDVKITPLEIEERFARLQSIQEKISSVRMSRFTGRTMDVLVEEKIEGTELSLGRAFPQAPEVDGSVVLRGGRLNPGDVCKVRIVRNAGIDLDAMFLESISQQFSS